MTRPSDRGVESDMRGPCAGSMSRGGIAVVAIVGGCMIDEGRCRRGGKQQAGSGQGSNLGRLPPSPLAHYCQGRELEDSKQCNASPCSMQQTPVEAS